MAVQLQSGTCKPLSFLLKHFEICYKYAALGIQGQTNEVISMFLFFFFFLSHTFCPESIFEHWITAEPGRGRPSMEAGLIYPALVLFISFNWLSW